MPELIPALIAKIKERYDMAIASRYLGNAKSQDDDFVTGFAHFLPEKIFGAKNKLGTAVIRACG